MAAERSPVTLRRSHECFATASSRNVRIDEFLADVVDCAASLADATAPVLNTRSDRYAFVVGFYAAAVCGRTTLLPQSRDSSAIAGLQQSTGAQILNDPPPRWQPGQAGRVEPTDPRASIDPATIVARAYTSGSTGESQAHDKSWFLLDRFRYLHARQLPSDVQDQRHAVVSTVPCWHMYGLEWVMLLPTVVPLTLHCGADFYPDDVARALSGADAPTMLVSTPVHLTALMRAARFGRATRLTLSATAPIDQAFAERVERALSTELLEIYGCSEIGSLARRATATQSHWQFFDEFSLQASANSQTLSVTHDALPDPVALADAFQPSESGYELLGRAVDIVKVGGKRESLSRLNVVLQGLNGVADGTFYDPAQLDDRSGNGRLAALVVAPGADPATLRRALAEQIDSAFLPRPLRLVSELPRSPNGKLQRAKLARLVRELDQQAAASTAS